MRQDEVRVGGRYRLRNYYDWLPEGTVVTVLSLSAAFNDDGTTTMGPPDELAAANIGPAGILVARTADIEVGAAKLLAGEELFAPGPAEYLVDAEALEPVPEPRA